MTYLILDVDKELEAIKSKVQQLQDSVDFMLPSVINYTATSIKQEKVTVEESFDMTIFPLKTLKDIEDLERRFLANPNLRKSLAAQLSRVGGNGTGDTCRRLMKRIMTDAVAQLFSYHGLKKKRSFTSLQLKDVLFDAIRRNNTITCTDKEIETIMQDWLRFAKFRLEKRK